ncbi:MAG: hypothetical protein LZF62_480233 [Nitrospira sp.]|nr:MAG: hypothetical protein LZF62_480233 [Nitrospira sp.]
MTLRFPGHPKSVLPSRPTGSAPRTTRYTGRVRSDGWTLGLFALRKHVFTKRDVDDQPFQSGIFRVVGVDAVQSRGMRVLRSPRLEGRVTNAQLPTRITDGVAASAWWIAHTIYSSENFERFKRPLVSYWTSKPPSYSGIKLPVVFQGEVTL